MEKVLSNNRKQQTTVLKRRTRLKKYLPIYMLLLPSMLLLLVFHYAPIFGIVIAFKNYSPFKGILGSDWAGIKYFASFLSDKNFWRVMKNTLIIRLYMLTFGFPAPIIFALLLNEIWSNKYKKIIQTVSYLPYFISWVVAAGIVTSVLSPSSGIVNNILETVFKIKPIYFLVKPQYFRSIIVISFIWKGFGMESVYYIASLSSIDQQLYEASTMDGAGRLRQTWHITLPGLRNIIIVLLVLKLGSIVTIGFEQIFLLYNPVVYDVGDVISTYTYRLGIEKTQYSLTTAIGLSQSLVNFLLVYLSNRTSRIVAGWSIW